MTPMEAPQRRIIDAAERWAPTVVGLRAVGLAGSWARGTAKAGSDVDLIVVVDDVEAWVSSSEWIGDFGQSVSVVDEDWGMVRSRRVQYASGAEVEFGLTTIEWAAVPLDAGTARVIADGFRILHDPDDLLCAVVRAVEGRTSGQQDGC